MLKFLADESCDFTIVRCLRNAGYHVKSIAEDMPGISDSEVLHKARQENCILLTEDKDFGEWIYAHGSVIEGLIFLLPEVIIQGPGSAFLSASYNEINFHKDLSAVPVFFVPRSTFSREIFVDIFPMHNSAKYNFIVFKIYPYSIIRNT